MKIAFAVNDIATEESGYTTTRLALAATNRGHEAWLVGMGDFAYDSDELIYARAVAAPRDNYKSGEAYLNDLRGPKGRRARVTISEFDVLMLRNDPSTDRGGRSWAQTAGINFGRMAMQHGVIVVNDPNGLAKALNKTYFQLFPAEVRPRTIITRDRKEVRSFADEHGGSVVLKPLSGSGGEGGLSADPRHAAEPEPNGRVNQSRRLRDRAGIPTCRQRWRHAALSAQRSSAAPQGQIRGVSPHPLGR
jgi:glutathione synthase